MTYITVKNNKINQQTKSTIFQIYNLYYLHIVRSFLIAKLLIYWKVLTMFAYKAKL